MRLLIFDDWTTYQFIDSVLIDSEVVLLLESPHSSLPHGWPAVIPLVCFGSRLGLSVGEYSGVVDS